jgi:hypothetical protein
MNKKEVKQRYCISYEIKTVNASSVEEFVKKLEALQENDGVISAISAVVAMYKLFETPE